MTNGKNEGKKQKLNQDGVKGILVWYLMVFGAFLTLVICAGTLYWLNAWIYLILSVVYTSINFIILGIKNPNLLNERGKLAKEGTKPFDRVFYALWLPMIYISMLIMAWDAVRFQWSSMPFWTVILGVVITIPALILGIWAMVSNPYFEVTVRIQEDRDHKVISSGPYKLIRHPGYSSEIVNLLSVPFMLGSWWGFVPIGVIILVFIIRTALEDRTLQKELPGYKEYAEETRYRLFPYIW
jgi:protein-S-isoprenylcysteine O-methyltransferase Ste14